MSRLHEPLTKGKHDQLASLVNEAIISIKIHHTIVPDEKNTPDMIEKVKQNYNVPTWEDIQKILEMCRDEMNSCREPLRTRF